MTFNVSFSLSVLDMFHIALAILGRVPRLKMVRHNITESLLYLLVGDCRTCTVCILIDFWMQIQNEYINMFYEISEVNRRDFQ